MEDMTSLIIERLAVLLPEIQIQREDLKAGFEEPSFYVKRVSTTLTPRLFRHQTHRYHFSIIYFPKPTRPNEDMDEMAEWLAECMQEIPGKVHFTEREIEVIDNELHFSFVAETNSRPADEASFDGELEYKGGLKP